MTLPARSEHESHDLALLTGNGAAEMLAMALGERSIVRSWRVHSQHHRPGAGVTVCYDVVVDKNLQDGRTERDQAYLCASTAKLKNPNHPALTHLQAGGTKVSVWFYPNDPELPALPMACSPSLMSELLGEPVGIELMSYRPTRRAVVKVTRTNGAETFGKVLRPGSAQDLVARHRVLEEANVPAPPVVFSNDDGLVLSSNLPGEPLRQSALARSWAPGAVGDRGPSGDSGCLAAKRSDISGKASMGRSRGTLRACGRHGAAGGRGALSGYCPAGQRTAAGKRSGTGCASPRGLL